MSNTNKKSVSTLKLSAKTLEVPENQRSIENLHEYLVNLKKDKVKILPREKMRFAIYLRKSTDNEDKQVRSIDDQRNECKEKAERLGVKVLKRDIFEESKSAKKANIRPVFSQLLDDFRLGKYHGLITWHPDRLSRNMKEAGEIIELVDKEVIQDLQFCTYEFENTPNGKMMLGILFATSKQYTDKLSVDVKRGITGAHSEGKYIGASKKGYYVDESTGHFLPDGENWELLRYAVYLRVYESKTLEEASEILNEAGFKALKIVRNKNKEKIGTKHVPHLFDKKNLGPLLKDSFYCGIYTYGDRVVNLQDAYPFKPLMSVDEYIQINQKVASDFDVKFAGRPTKAKRLNYGLLRDKVICGYCEVAMQFQQTKIPRGQNKGSWQITFYCRKNKDNLCIRHRPEDAVMEYGKKLAKSIRARTVMRAIELKLKSCTKESKEAYGLYKQSIEQEHANNLAITERQVRETDTKLRAIKKQYKTYQDLQLKDSKAYEEHHEGKLDSTKKLIEEVRAQLEVAKKKREEAKNDLPSEKEFYELTDSYLETLLKTEDLVQIDYISNLLVSNLIAFDESVSVINLNSPFDLLVETEKVVHGRAKNEAAEPIIETLHELLKNYKRMRRRVDKLEHLIENMVKPDLTSVRFLR